MTLPKKRKYRRSIRATGEGAASTLELSPAIERILAEERERQPRCSFCGKSPNEVKKMIGARGQIYICNECIDICNAIIADDQQYRL